MDGEAEGHHEALDQAMAVRRGEVRKRWNAVASDAGMTPQHLSRIRRGQTPLNEFAARGLDQALDWPAGTAIAYYRKGRPPGPAERPAIGSDEWWADLARQLPEDKFWEVVEHAKANKRELAKRLAQLLEANAERDSRRETGSVTASE